MKQNKKQITFWARKCDITGEGMNEGYLIEDGFMYIKYDKDMIKHLRKVDEDEIIDKNTHYYKKSNDELYEEYYENDYYYWTEWEDHEYEHQYVEIDGVMYEEGEKQYDMAIEMKKVAPNQEL